MDPLKEAFSKVREDIDTLYKEVGTMRSDLIETRKQLIEICEILNNFNIKFKELSKKEHFDTSTHKPQNPAVSTHTSTHNYPLEPLKGQNIPISTGNQGVPTDRQTDRQTDNKQLNSQKTDQNSIDNAVKILDSLDSIKKEIRLKFKRLTDQEILVFSTLYQLEEESSEGVDYKSISKKLNLTESSIRDYIGRLIKKGISVDKKRVNNKTIHLSISPNLKKIASLSTILQLREL